MPTDLLKKELKELRQWFEREHQAAMPDAKRQRMASYVDGKTHIGAATVGLGYFASYLGIKGSLQVLDGDEAGFRDIDTSLLYTYWAIRLLAKAYDADTRSPKQPRVTMDRAATCWMHAAALGTREILDWFAERIRLIDAGDQSIGGKNMNALCTLMAHFVTEHDAKALAGAGWAPIGVYEPVIKQSLRPDDYDALAAYHVKRIQGADFPEFQSNPYSVIPFELLAIEKRTSVPIQNPRHPLLTSSLATRREVIEIPVTPELAAIIEKAKSEFPV